MICNLGGGVWTLSRLKQKKTKNYQMKFNKIRKLSREQTLVASTHPSIGVNAIYVLTYNIIYYLTTLVINYKVIKAIASKSSFLA